MDSESEGGKSEWWNINCCEGEGKGGCVDGPKFFTISAKITIGSLLEGYR